MCKNNYKTIFVLVMLVFVSGCKKAEIPAQKTSRPVISVELVSATPIPISNNINVGGYLYPESDVGVSVETTNTPVMDIVINNGDSVKRGEILAVLDNRTIAIDIKTSQSEVMLNQAEYELAKANLSRIMGLSKSAVSQAEIDNLTALQKVALAKLEISQSKLAGLQLMYDKTVLKSPSDGVVYQKNINLGQTYQSGFEAFKIIKNGVLEWHAEVPTAISHQVGLKNQALIKDNGKVLQGVVKSVNPVLDNSKNTIVAVRLFSALNLFVGQYVQGQIMQPKINGYSIPMDSIIQLDGKSYIMTADLGIARRYAINISDIRHDEAVVLDYDPHIKFIKTGAGFLEDGDSVNVTNADNKKATKS